MVSILRRKKSTSIKKSSKKSSTEKEKNEQTDASSQLRSSTRGHEEVHEKVELIRDIQEAFAVAKETKRDEHCENNLSLSANTENSLAKGKNIVEKGTEIGFEKNESKEQGKKNTVENDLVEAQNNEEQKNVTTSSKAEADDQATTSIEAEADDQANTSSEAKTENKATNEAKTENKATTSSEAKTDQRDIEPSETEQNADGRDEVQVPIQDRIHEQVEAFVARGKNCITVSEEEKRNVKQTWLTFFDRLFECAESGEHLCVVCSAIATDKVYTCVKGKT